MILDERPSDAFIIKIDKNRYVYVDSRNCKQKVQIEVSYSVASCIVFG